MKLLLTFFILTLSVSLFAQKNNTAIETEYDLKINGKMKAVGHIPESSYLVHIEVTIINDGNYSLFIPRLISMTNSMMNLSQEEQEPDTVMFDVRKGIAYNLRKKRSYRFKQRNFLIASNYKDSVIMKNQDTTIFLLKTLDKRISPTPTMGSFEYGVRSYSTKTFTFTYVNSKTSKLILSKIYDRCKNYQHENSELEFMY